MASRAPLRHWLLYFGWWLALAAIAAGLLLFVAALLVWRQWLLAAFFAAITVIWVRRVVILSELPAFVRYRLGRRRR